MCTTITPSALAFMRRMLRLSGNPAYAIRLLATPGGCSGLGIDLSVEAKASEGDVTTEYEGLTLHMPPATQALLEGCTLDFADTVHSSGFVVRGSQGACGCQGAAVAPAVIDVSRLRHKV
ncbi:iron-sulfur cluster assembly accessory protein [Acidiferrobacter sp.]|uniref:HesB/IscA family protein n=1 Tax=Acidiferrobacter sp. TaxID=1872107 RepID=UPI0026395C60|nr:iron-sulfur cluster assembly accessory protein [Acidiferrobacter sp.]